MTDIVKAEETGLANYQDELAKYAKEASSSEVLVGGPFLRIKGGALMANDQQIKGNEAEIIVLDSVFEFSHYEGEYDPDNKAPPVCYAFGRTDEAMKPHEKASKPQNANCADCPHNQFGSAAKGRGKACGNHRRLCLVPMTADLDPSTLLGSELWYHKLSVTNCKNWATYVKSLEALYHLPPFAVVTKMKVSSHPKNQFQVTFDYVRTLDQAWMGSLIKKHQMAKEAICFPYAPPNLAEKAAEPAKRGKEKF